MPKHIWRDLAVVEAALSLADGADDGLLGEHRGLGGRVRHAFEEEVIISR